MQKLFLMATLLMSTFAQANITNIPAGTTVDCISNNNQINIQITGPYSALIRLERDSEYVEASLRSELDIDTYTFERGYIRVYALFGMGPDIADGVIDDVSINNMQCENNYPTRK